MKKLLNQYSLNKSLFTFLLFVLALAFLVESESPVLSPLTIAAIPVVLLCLVSFWKPYLGLLLSFLYAVAMFTAIRLFPGYPFGIFFDFLILSSFCGIIFKNLYQGSNEYVSKGILGNPVTIALLIWIGYNLLQCFNPANLSFDITIATVRLYISYFLLFCLGILLFNKEKRISHFTSFWLSIAVVIAIYTFWQNIQVFLNLK